MIRTNRLIVLAAAWIAAGTALAGCEPPASGPVRIVAVGAAPAMVNPNRQPVMAGSALLLDTVAQGLVRFDAAGEIEPALAQSWIVSDDGRRYTFRVRRTLWARGEPVNARQVAERLQATMARGSRNSLLPVLGAIDSIEAMTDQVLEIRLKAPRPNFLQLLAQPEMAIVAGNEGTGPYRLAGDDEGALRLIPPQPDEDADRIVTPPPSILLSSAPAAVAIARFGRDGADLVTGGTLADAPLLGAADLPRQALVFDPARGLFGLAFLRTDGPLAAARFRHALSMAIDREAIQARFGIATLQARSSLLPTGLSEISSPAVPDWTTVPLDTRRNAAARIVAEYADVARPVVRIALPPGLGYRILFAHIARDWRAIGVEARAIAPDTQADLRFIDEVAPADLTPWYLRHFVCGASAVCDRAIDEQLENARNAPDPATRAALLVQADRALTATAAFIPIGQPVRWSLRTSRLEQFRPNIFARHPPTELLDSED